MRIALLVGAFPQVSETFLFRKMVGLAERGHLVTVLARQQGNWAAFKEHLPLHPGISIRYLLPEWNLSRPEAALALAKRLPCYLTSAVCSWFSLIERCRRHPATRHSWWRQFLRHLPLTNLSADILHFEFLSLAVMYPLLGKISKIPWVVSCRGSDVHLLEQRVEDEKNCYLRALTQAAAVHCVSKEMATHLQKMIDLNGRLFVNRSAVETDKIKARKVAQNVEVPLILSVGRLVWQKGYDYLLAALISLKREGVRFKAKIIGEGPLYAPLKYSLQDLGLEAEVELAGVLPSGEVLRCMQFAEVFVLSSHTEGISNAVLEAMASGLPVVTTDAGGMKEAVTDGVEGYVVPVRDIDALAGHLKKLIQDPELRLKMGKAARIKAEKDFSLARQVTLFEEMYQKVLNANRGSYGVSIKSR